MKRIKNMSDINALAQNMEERALNEHLLEAHAAQLMSRELLLEYLSITQVDVRETLAQVCEEE